MAVEQALQEFRETESGEAFSLQNDRLLKVELAGVTIQAKLGAMVAYQGDVKFERAAVGGMARLVKKVATGEGAKLMKVSGTGEVFLADHAQEVHLVKLADDKITVNSDNLLAFEDGIDWNIRKVEGASGVLAGGLFNLELAGSGWVALLSDGPPMLLQLKDDPAFADPQAAITWSSGVKTSVKTDVNLKTLIGRGSGESAPDAVLRRRLAAGAAIRGPRERRGLGIRSRRRARRPARRRLRPDPGNIPGVTPRVEFLWWEGCPSHERALAELRDAMADAGLDPDAVEVREVGGDEDAAREAFVGSPTIRIDGRDLSPPPAGEPIGLTCRVYRLRDGRVSPTPDPADLRDALNVGDKAG